VEQIPKKWEELPNDPIIYANQPKGNYPNPKKVSPKE